MLALVRHHCPCGRSYVVSLAGDEDLERRPSWGDGPARPADGNGDVIIDGRSAGFFCTSCSRLHLRVGPPVVQMAGEDADGLAYAFTLN